MPSSLPTRPLGDLQVGAIGLGCMPMSGMPSRPEVLDQREQSVRVIHSAIESGVTLLDTADIYAPAWDAFGHNEVLVAEAFHSYSGPNRDRVVIATKAGITRGPGESWGRAANLDYLMRAVEASLGRLRLDRIPLWQHHRLDPSLPFETQFENALVLRQRGLVERIGVSNYDAEQLRRAVRLAGPGGVVSIQNQYSPKYRHSDDVFDVCAEHGIAFLPWSPLGGVREAHHLSAGISEFVRVGEEKGVSAQVVALAWLLHRSPNVIPIPGATRVESVTDNLAAASLEFTSEELARLEAALPPNAEVSDELSPAPPFRD